MISRAAARGPFSSMHKLAPVGLLVALLAASFGQDPASKGAEFTAEIEKAQRAFARDERGATVAALRQAILVVQQRQRAAVLAVLPTPAGFTHEDVAPANAAKDPFAVEIAALGLDVERRYRGSNDARFDIEVSTDSPLVEVFARLLEEPAKVLGSGGRIVKYGEHSALVKFKDGHGEVTVVLRDRHVVKVTADAMTEEVLNAIVDGAVVDRIDRELAR